MTRYETNVINQQTRRKERMSAANIRNTVRKNLRNERKRIELEESNLVSGKTQINEKFLISVMSTLANLIKSFTLFISTLLVYNLLGWHRET